MCNSFNLSIFFHISINETNSGYRFYNLSLSLSSLSLSLSLSLISTHEYYQRLWYVEFAPTYFFSHISNNATNSWNRFIIWKICCIIVISIWLRLQKNPKGYMYSQMAIPASTIYPTQISSFNQQYHVLTKKEWGMGNISPPPPSLRKGES